MSGAEWIAAEQEAKQAWEAVATRHREIEERLARTGAERDRAATAREDHDRLAARAATLVKLARIVGGETERAHRAWQKCVANLWEPNHPGTYKPVVLRAKAAAGEVCPGHRVWLEDVADGSAFAFLLTGGDAPVEGAVRGRFVGESVTVSAPGGAYACRIVSVCAGEQTG